MTKADLAITAEMFRIIAPTAAAEMRSRSVGRLREMAFSGEFTPAECKVLHRAIVELELLPLSKEATT